MLKHPLYTTLSKFHVLQCHNRKLAFSVILKGLRAQRMFRLSTYKEPEHNITDKLPQYIYIYLQKTKF